MFLTLPVAVFMVDGAGSGRWGGIAAAALAGWWFGFGYFLAGLYWIGFAFLVDAKTFGWLMPFAVVALPAGLAIFTALGFALARALWARGPLRILTLAAALTAVEWLRGHVLTGFPWNTYGYALTGAAPLAQNAAIFGLWGLTFIAIAVFSSPAVLLDERKDTPRALLIPAGALLVLAALAVNGATRLASHPTTFVDGVRLRVMQPNLSQDTKFNYGARHQVMQRYLTLSDQATGPQSSGIREITHLIWPESAFPFFLTREPEALAEIAKLLPEGTVLITGAARAAEIQENPRRVRAYNSIYVIDHDGGVLSVYDKVHLVPFGEYLPFQAFLEHLGLMHLTKMPGGFLNGTRRQPIAVPRAPAFLPLICYEIIFPDEAVPDGERPGWLVNVTNDAWFGISPGPYQHFQQARVRAIEEGLPLVRAANTGISAVTDPLGRVVQALPLGAEGVLDSRLPAPIAATLYRSMGDFPVLIVVLAAIGWATIRKLRG